MTRQTLLNN